MIGLLLGYKVFLYKEKNVWIKDGKLKFVKFILKLNLKKRKIYNIKKNILLN